jgi:hypothetical protein
MDNTLATGSVQQLDGDLKLLFSESGVIGFFRDLEFFNRGTDGALCLSVSHSSGFTLAFSFRRGTAVKHVIPPKVFQLFALMFCFHNQGTNE